MVKCKFKKRIIFVIISDYIGYFWNLVLFLSINSLCLPRNRTTGILVSNVYSSRFAYSGSYSLLLLDRQWYCLTFLCTLRYSMYWHFPSDFIWRVGITNSNTGNWEFCFGKKRKSIKFIQLIQYPPTPIL